MVNKVLIDATNYRISAGKTLIDATVHEIKNGKVLIDGSIYNVSIRLPYKRLEYIQSDGASWVNTGYVYKSVPQFEIDWSATNTKNSEIFGWGPKDRKSFLVNSDEVRSKWNICFWSIFRKSGVDPMWSNMEADRCYNAVIGNRYMLKGYLDGNNYRLSANGSGTEYGYVYVEHELANNLEPALIFNGRGGTGYAHPGKLWGVKMWDSGTLVRDYVPCKTDEGEVGLYDLVTEKFYGSAGEPFVAGPETGEVI
jgi:hypothetical protein